MRRSYASGIKAGTLCFGTSAASSVLHNLATSGHLVFSRTALSFPPTRTSSCQSDNPGIQNVCPFDHQLHRQAPMAQALDDPHRPVVHRCRRLQTPRTEVIIALPSMPPIPAHREQSTTISVLCVVCDSKALAPPTIAIGGPCRIRPPAVTPDFSYASSASDHSH